MRWDGSGGSAITSVRMSRGRIFYFKRRTSNAVAYLTNLLRVGAVAF